MLERYIDGPRPYVVLYEGIYKTYVAVADGSPRTDHDLRGRLFSFDSYERMSSLRSARDIAEGSRIRLVLRDE